MENSEIKKLLEEGLVCQHVEVEGDGYHYQVRIISEAFQDLNKVKRNQKVYQILGNYIQNGQLHALTINALTPKEWEGR